MGLDDSMASSRRVPRRLPTQRSLLVLLIVPTLVYYDMRNRGALDSVDDAARLTIQDDVLVLEAIDRFLDEEWPDGAEEIERLDPDPGGGRPMSGGADYSGTPLVRKLGLKAGMTVRLLDAPEGYWDLLGTSPVGPGKSLRLPGASLSGTVIPPGVGASLRIAQHEQRVEAEDVFLCRGGEIQHARVSIGP